jgi:hypothetical protein
MSYSARVKAYFLHKNYQKMFIFSCFINFFLILLGEVIL